MQRSSKIFKPKNKSTYDGYTLDDHITLRRKRAGIIHYIGRVQDKKGIWFGIELITPHQNGKHNGAIGGVEYFKCKSHKGIFVQSKDILRKIIKPTYNTIDLDNKSNCDDDDTNLETSSDTVITMSSHDLDDSGYHGIMDINYTNYSTNDATDYIKSSKQYKYFIVDTNDDDIRKPKVPPNRKRSTSSPNDTNIKPISRRKRLSLHIKNSSDPITAMTVSRKVIKPRKPVDLNEMIKASSVRTPMKPPPIDVTLDVHSSLSKTSDENFEGTTMTSHEQVASSSPNSDHTDNMDTQRKDTQMTEVTSRTDSYVQTPEPEDDKDLNKTNDNNDDEEEKDDLYNQLAPKQTVTEQLQNVVDNVPDQNNISPPTPYESDGLAGNDSYDSDPSNYLKSTLKQNQRAWVDPWEAAVQDTFYHKEITTLRPTFDIVHNQIKGVESLRSLFDTPNAITEHFDEENPDDIELEEEEKAMAEPKQPRKFGPWDGVMAGCLLNIFGVIMFLRVGFVVGQSGIIGALIIMTISAVVVVLTALSMSAICTNGTILAGGAYYIISRALGPSVGGAIGILFSIGNMVACSMYLIGFAETLVANLSDSAGFQIFSDPIMDVRIWSNVVLCLVLILAIVGLKYVIKAQLGLLVFIVIAIILFFIGGFYKEIQDEDGLLIITPKGWINGNFITNLGGGYEDYDFWGVLAIFFPAVTGIMAGANISGDLRDPSHDIPKGTLTAIFISTIVYMLLAVFVGAITVRSALISNELVMSLICVNEYIVLVGIYAATLSSAIASLVGAPRILMAVASDKLFPFKWLSFFGKSDSDGNPIRGYFLSFSVAFCCNLIGALNAIAPLISQFFMLTYLLINFACFALEISKSPGWRPSFKYFNKWTSGVGSLLCLVIMFLLNWAYALVACLIALLIYLYVEWKDPEVNWGAAPQARKFYAAYKAILKLRKTKTHIKNWRPGLLVLVRDPIKRAQMMLFAQTLKKGHGPIFYATVHTGDYRTNIRKFHEAHSLGYLPANSPKNSKGFYESVLADTLRSGVQNLFQLVGMGSLRPNTLVIGYKRKWRRDSDDIINEFVQILRDTLVMGMGLMVAVGFKRVNWFLDEYAPPALQHDIDDFPEIYQGKIGTASAGERTDHIQNVSPAMSMPRNQEQEDAAIFLSEAWALGQSKDTVIDVWWMIDDGGLCMLIPYIMKLHKFWQRCDLRMLMVSDQNSVSTDISTMKGLIDNFRLPYKGPLLVPAKTEPHPKTIEKYEELAKTKLNDTPRPGVIKKWLILSELLFEYSRYSGLNVVTLPIPTKSITARSYMALLHMLSDQDRLPPTIIMRGNGESTLTFYSE